MSFSPHQFTQFTFVEHSLRADGCVRFRYELSGSGVAIPFEERWDFGNLDWNLEQIEAIRSLSRLLFLAAGTSYYKAAAPSRVIVRGQWSAAERDFVQLLLQQGLAEFAYRNNLSVPLQPHIVCDGETTTPAGVEFLPRPAGAPLTLTPVGGGKDSCVSIDALERHGFRQVLFSVGNYAPIVSVAETSGYPLYSVSRRLSPNLLELNAEGALNGHVPVTAINSVAALIASVAVNSGNVFMSNERSASTPTLVTKGFPVNHQWSKGLAFEGALRDLLAAELPGLTYASLLRPYSEFRIAQAFAELEPFHGVFVSCGSAFRRSSGTQRRWCGACAKCRFVALILSPFLTHQKVVSMMGVDAVAHASESDLGVLVGVQDNRPFDCVGEVAETRYALLHSDPSWRSLASISGTLETIGGWEPTAAERWLIVGPGTDHFLPPELSAVLDER